MTNWKPGASSQALKKRAELFANLRAFFSDKGIIEVETPVLAGAPVTDLHIQSLTTEISFGNSSKTFYLQTSPEFAMKRLLADNPEPIIRLVKCFAMIQFRSITIQNLQCWNGIVLDLAWNN